MQLIWNVNFEHQNSVSTESLLFITYNRLWNLKILLELWKMVQIGISKTKCIFMLKKKLLLKNILLFRTLLPEENPLKFNWCEQCMTVYLHHYILFQCPSHFRPNFEILFSRWCILFIKVTVCSEKLSK